MLYTQKYSSCCCFVMKISKYSRRADKNNMYFRLAVARRIVVKCEVSLTNTVAHLLTYSINVSLCTQLLRAHFFLIYSFFFWMTTKSHDTDSQTERHAHKNWMQYEINTTMLIFKYLRTKSLVMACHATLNKWYELCWTTVKQTDIFTTGAWWKCKRRKKIHRSGNEGKRNGT